MANTFGFDDNFSISTKESIASEKAYIGKLRSQINDAKQKYNDGKMTDKSYNQWASKLESDIMKRQEILKLLEEQMKG